MLKDLAPGIKISISRSISKSFEQYMSRIGWDENKYSLENFIKEWREYIINSSSWYGQISEEIKADPAFHEELAAKINKTIDKILNEEPTQEQIEDIEKLQLQRGKEFDFSCKMEAKYIIDTQKN